jgi:hypothetical protein
VPPKHNMSARAGMKERKSGEVGRGETYELSDEDAFSTKARRILCPPSPASSIPSPKAITSSATLFFLSFFARRTSARSASGEASSSGRTDKDDHALPEVLVLAVLERELRDGDRRRDRRRAAEVGRGLVHGFENLAELFGVRDEHLRADERHITRMHST